MENGVAILWKNYLQLSVKNSCKKQSYDKVGQPPLFLYILPIMKVHTDV
jgi:hypothetical protein